MADQNPGENLELKQQVEYLRGLAQIVADEGLSEIEIRADGLKLTLKAASLKFAAPSPTAPLVMSATPAPPSKAARNEESLTPVVSPMVGVFYRAPSPTDPNFVEIGDRVERGQTIGLVEAMKVFNEVTAENAGVVAQIPVQTGQLVETGQPLLLLK